MTTFEYRGQKVTTRRRKDKAYGVRTEVRINGQFIWTYSSDERAITQTRLDIDGALERPYAFPWVRHQNTTN